MCTNNIECYQHNYYHVSTIGILWIHNHYIMAATDYASCDNKMLSGWHQYHF